MRDREAGGLREPEGEALQVDFSRYLLLLRKWGLAVAAVVALAAVAAVFHTRRQTPLYWATATVQVDPQAPAVLGREADQVVDLSDGWGRADYYRSQAQLLQSRMLARRTVEVGGFDREPKLIGDAEPGGELARQRAEWQVSAALRIRPPSDDRVFQISAISPHPELAARIANAHVTAYVAHHRGVRTRGTGDASEWLGKELAKAEESLRKSEAGVYEFRRDNNMLAMTLDERRQLILRDVERYAAAQGEAQVERLNLGKLREQVVAKQGVDVLDSPVFELAESETGRQLKTSYFASQARLAELRADFGDKHADVIAQTKILETIRTNLQREAALILATLDEKLSAATKREQAFAGELARLQADAFALGPREIEYRRLQRKEEVDRDQLGLLTGRLRSSELESRLDATNIQPIDEALVPGAPFAPDLRKNVTIAGAGALVLALGVLALVGFLDRKVRTPEHLEALSPTVLGILPTMPVVSAARGDGVLAHLRTAPQAPAAEAARGVRTNLLFASADAEVRSIMVTSSVHFEGKTSTTMALALSMAESGKRVLVVDADMRRPRLASVFETPAKPGISEVLLGEASIDDAIKTTEVHGLKLMPCGRIPPNPCELMMTARFREFVAELEGRFDLVLFDTPPALEVADATVLGQLVDGVVLVARAGHSQVADIRRTEAQLRSVDARVLGWLLNGFDSRRRGYYYYRYAAVPERAAESQTG